MVLGSSSRLTIEELRLVSMKMFRTRPPHSWGYGGLRSFEKVVVTKYAKLYFSVLKIPKRFVKGYVVLSGSEYCWKDVSRGYWDVRWSPVF